MNLLKRAFLYTTRKKGKSLLLFLILLVIATFALAGLSIREASGTAALNLRQSLGGGFTVGLDRSDLSKYKSNASGAMVYQGKSLNREIAEKIMTVGGIDAYNATVRGVAEIKNTDRAYLTHFVVDNDIMAGNPDFEHMVTVMGQTNTKYSSYFVNGSLKLIDGRHVAGNDKNTAIIHRELAEKNNLKIGDKIVLSMSPFITSNDEAAAKSAVEVEIVGIFDSVTKQVSQGFASSESAIENTILIDVDSSLNLYAWGNDGYESIDYYVNDPGQLDNIIHEVKDIGSIDWSSFNITTNDKTFQSASEPLQNLNSLITTLIFIILVISVAILSLILTMWIKNRVHETGILLSIGISKTKIVLQYMAEILIIAVLAFGISFFSSNAVAQSVGNSLLEYASSDTVQTEQPRQPSNVYTDSAPEMAVNGTDLTDINVEVNPVNMIWIYLMGSMVIVLSVAIASIPILRLKPKEILTKMS